MGVRTGLPDRWYVHLVHPVLGTIAAALTDVADDDNPWSVPRTGLGGAIAVHVARAFGRRRWHKRAGRSAIAALEAYNQRAHVHPGSVRERSRLLRADLRWLDVVCKQLADHDGALVSRTLGRMLGLDVDLGEAAIPESVLFMRAAVAAGVIVGDVDDATHAALDQYVTWLALARETRADALDKDLWDGALGAIGLRTAFPEDPLTAAQHEADLALAALPTTAASSLFKLAIDRSATDEQAAHRPPAWLPELAPITSSGLTGFRVNGALGHFWESWREPIEFSMARFPGATSASLRRAAEYIQRRGGKRVRPLVAAAAAAACGAQPDRAIYAGAAIEWLHQSSLLLDDIIDEAPMRRGGQTLHLATSQRFTTGIAAILLARVHNSLHAMHPEIRKRMSQATSALFAGERLELLHTADVNLTITDYYRIINNKTAELFSCAAAVGGLCVQAAPRRVKALADFGREAGLAFQIVDDLLDYIGDEQTLGKTPGTDLRASKVTLPLLLLHSESGGSVDLGDILGKVEALPELVGMMHRHDVPARCTARARKHLASAHGALERLPGRDGVKVLEELSTLFVDRQR